jgi:hypothetical protein
MLNIAKIQKRESNTIFRLNIDSKTLHKIINLANLAHLSVFYRTQTFYKVSFLHTCTLYKMAAPQPLQYHSYPWLFSFPAHINQHVEYMLLTITSAFTFHEKPAIFSKWALLTLCQETTTEPHMPPKHLTFILCHNNSYFLFYLSQNVYITYRQVTYTLLASTQFTHYLQTSHIQITCRRVNSTACNGVTEKCVTRNVLKYVSTLLKFSVKVTS